LWLFVLMSAVKAVQTILNHQEASNLPYSLRTIGSHEDVVFIGAAIALALVAVHLGYRSRLVFALLALQPLFLTAELLANRRVGFIALGVMFLAVAIVAVFTRPARATVTIGIVA